MTKRERRLASAYWGKKGHKAQLDAFDGNVEEWKAMQADYGRLRGLTKEERLLKLLEIVREGAKNGDR